MAQPIASAAVGRVNRRFLLLALILAALSAVLVYAATSRSDGGGSGSATTVPVVVAKAAIPAGTTITGDMIELVDVADASVGDQALSSTDAVVGRAARYPISANEQILLKDIVSGDEAITNDVLANILEGGQRGMAIQTEAVIGGGGLVLPGDHVDVLWIPNDPTDDVHGAQLLAEDVEVVAVEQTLVEIAPTAPGLETDATNETSTGSGDRARGAEAEANPEAVTVTLMVTPEQAQRIFCGDEGGVIRLAVRAFGDRSPSGLQPVDCIIRGQEEQ